MPRKPNTRFGSAKPEACKSSAEICHIAALEKGDELFLLKGRSSPSKCLKKLLFLPRAEGSRVLGWGITQGSFWGSGLGVSGGFTSKEPASLQNLTLLEYMLDWNKHSRCL